MSPAISTGDKYYEKVRKGKSMAKTCSLKDASLRFHHDILYYTTFCAFFNASDEIKCNIWYNIYRKRNKGGDIKTMEISRVWCMPDSKTFNIRPIRELICRYIDKLPDGSIIADPFANESKLGNITNDLDMQYDTDYHMDATDFLCMLSDESCDMVLYDPPYSPRQVAECYKALGETVNMQTTQASYWSKQKKEIGRIVKKGGYCITCGWNSGGIGKKYGFEIIEILLVPHGGWHNDTIVTVEKKIR